jgi:hypothetical protein
LPQIRRWTARTRDRFLASDPGLGRLRTASAATVAMAVTLGVEHVFATLMGATGMSRLISMLIGAVVAMMGAMALTGTGAWRKVKTAAAFPVAIGAGLAAGAAVDRYRTPMLAGFVVIMFLAVYVRRFGLPFFFYGFMLWMGYFFAIFLQLTFPMVPSLLGAVVVGSATVLVLSLTVLRTNPRKVLRSSWWAYVARGRALVGAGGALLADGSTATRERRLREVAARQAGVSEAGLMLEAWSEERGALPPGWSGAALRRHAIDVQQTLDRITEAALGVAGAVGAVGAEPDLRSAAGRVLRELALGRDAAAHEAAGRLRREAEVTQAQDPVAVHARRLAAAAEEFVELVGTSPQPPDVESQDDVFEPASPLMMGNLPGSPAVARDVPARGVAWNPVARLSMTSRQAVQASAAGGLAILAGMVVSPARYYWAVIAAFVVFTGTGTRSETFLKAIGRVVGTAAGLGAAIWLAHLTHGEPAWVLVVVLASMFLGFYLVRVSTAYLMFFVTIMLGQLYSVLNQFSSGVLVLRVEETAVGALVGIVVALVVVPVSTRDTVQAATENLLEALARLLDRVAAGDAPPAASKDGDDEDDEDDGPRDPDALVRALENRARQLALVGKPLTRPLVWGNDSLRSRHRISLYAGMSAHGRMLVTALRRSPVRAPAAVAEVCAVLAEAARSMAKGDPAGLELESAERLLDAAEHEGPAGDALRPLVHLHRSLVELADPAPAELSGATMSP